MNESTTAENRLKHYSSECTVKSQANHSRLTVLPQALFHSRQMEGNITTACTIAFIKQHTKAVLTVIYFLGERERELSKKQNWYGLEIHLKRETLSSWNPLMFCMYFWAFAIFVFIFSQKWQIKVSRWNICSSFALQIDLALHSQGKKMCDEHETEQNRSTSAVLLPIQTHKAKTH